MRSVAFSLVFPPVVVSLQKRISCSTEKTTRLVLGSVYGNREIGTWRKGDISEPKSVKVFSVTPAQRLESMSSASRLSNRLNGTLN